VNIREWERIESGVKGQEVCARSEKLDCSYAAAGFLRTLNTNRTERPITIPAIIDSSGKPGIAGTTRGVVALDEDDTVTVTTLGDVAVLLES
jgi:hypothetical protein